MARDGRMVERIQQKRAGKEKNHRTRERMTDRLLDDFVLRVPWDSGQTSLGKTMQVAHMAMERMYGQNRAVPCCGFRVAPVILCFVKAFET